MDYTTQQSDNRRTSRNPKMSGGGHHNNSHTESPGGGRGDSASRAAASKYDDPPNSRLFIVCGKQVTEEAFRTSFGRFGTIEEVWMVKDRVTGEPKGVTYIKFTKTSEAALAMEEMNGRCIEGSPRPLKVLIAHSRDQGSRRDNNEEERLVRLFVVVSRSAQENDIREHFSRFGDIDYVSIVKDRNTRESKGFAYVKYHRMSHAAKAFEECDRSYKPVFAEPKPGAGGGGHGGKRDDHNERGHHHGGHHDAGHHHGGHGGRGYSGPGSTASGSTSASMSASYDLLSYMDTAQTNPEGVCRVSVSASSSLSQEQIWRLFDLIPGLDYCDRNARSNSNSRPNSRFTVYSVVYNNPTSATYARDKLNGFEYPVGARLSVKFDQSYENKNANNNNGRGYPPTAQAPPPPVPAPQFIRGPPAQPPPPPQNRQGPNLHSDLAQLTETIANATALLQAAGYNAPGAPGAPNAPIPAPVVSAALSAQAQPPPPQPQAVAPGQPQQPQAPPAQGQGVLVSATGETYDPSYCSVKLPAPQPLAAMESNVEERLFIVCTSVPPQLYALKDVFGRFGNLIDVYLLNGKSCGYAKYANRDSAERAASILNGQEVCGSRLKVMKAEPQDSSRQQQQNNGGAASATSTSVANNNQQQSKRAKIEAEANNIMQ